MINITKRYAYAVAIKSKSAENIKNSFSIMFQQIKKNKKKIDSLSTDNRKRIFERKN